MNKTALIIGGGVAGVSCAYYLRKKNYHVTILEQQTYLGGMSHTSYYNGHPYEFGPHVWFWPHDDINDVIRELTNDELYQVDRKLYTFTGDALYRYPIHYSDIEMMLDKEQILDELMVHRTELEKLDSDKIPQLGECKFSEYFRAALGGTLYNKFMKEYTHKMWGISGDELDTNLVWADRIKDSYSGSLPTYDPIKFHEVFLGEGQPNWYPKKGWNIVWEGMARDCDIRFGVGISKLLNNGDLLTTSGIYHLASYDLVINTLHSDTLLGEYVLPANGRLVIPFLVPGLSSVFPSGVESIHFADTNPLTRTTDMKVITRHESLDSLICLEIPVTSTSQGAFPSNVLVPRHYQPRCYNWQTEAARAQHNEYVERAQAIAPNLLFCGRAANFKYWGMPQTVNAAKSLVESL